MSDDDPDTLTTEPLAEEATKPSGEDPAAAAALQPPSDGTETKPGDGPEPSGDGDGDTPKKEAPPAPVWAAITDPDELLRHEEFAPRIAEREVAAQDKGRTEALETMRESHQAHEERLNAIDGKVGRFMGAFNKLTKGENPITVEALSDLMEEHSEAFDALRGVGQELGKWSGAAGLVNGLAEAIKSEEFGSKFRSRLSKMQRGLTDPTLFSDMASAIAGEAKKPLQDELKELKAQVERVEVEKKTLERNGTQPPADIAGKGGGRKIDPSDSARLDRLAYGKDGDGNAPTDEDRAWIAARGN